MSLMPNTTCDSDFLHNEPVTPAEAEAWKKTHRCLCCPECGEPKVWVPKSQKRTGLRKGTPRYDGHKRTKKA